MVILVIQPDNNSSNSHVPFPRKVLNNHSNYYKSLLLRLSPSREILFLVFILILIMIGFTSAAAAVTTTTDAAASSRDRGRGNVNAVLYNGRRDLNNNNDINNNRVIPALRIQNRFPSSPLLQDDHRKWTWSKDQGSPRPNPVLRRRQEEGEHQEHEMVKTSMSTSMSNEIREMNPSHVEENQESHKVEIEKETAEAGTEDVDEDETITAGQLLPIINDLTFLALIVLHTPLIITLMVVPLISYIVGIVLIPIVRVNYFINHKDDGEDGRQAQSQFGELVITVIKYVLNLFE